MHHGTLFPEAVHGEDGSEYIEKAMVDIEQEAVLQLEGQMFSQFLTVKIQDVKNCS
jgi:hypothetical protein